MFLIPGHTNMESGIDHSIIEKKKFNGSIEHPHDWAILISQCEKANPMKVIELTTYYFFEFSDLHSESGSLSNRKENTQGENINWRQIK